MAYPQQTFFTASASAVNTALQRLWRWGASNLPSTQLQQFSIGCNITKGAQLCAPTSNLYFINLKNAIKQGTRRIQRRWMAVLIGLLTLLFTLVTVPTTAQTPPAKAAAEAPIVVDGRVLFQVRNSGNFTASERAAIINTNLEQELQSSEPVDLEVVQEDQLTSIRTRTGDRTLMTLSEGDVIPGTSPVRQATIWKNSITSALRQGQLERNPVYFRQAQLFSLGVLLGAVIGHFSFGLIGKLASGKLTRVLGHPASPLHPWEQSAKLFLQLAILGLQAGLWIAVTFYITDLFPQGRSWRYQLFNFLNSPVVSFGESQYSALQLLLLIAFTGGLWFAVSGLTRLFKFYVLSKTGAELRIQEVVAVLTQYVLTFLGLIVLLQIWGLDVSSLAILASVLGVGIGFGVQNITNNLISGLIITLERPIQVGDFVKVGELTGIVERIGARSTEIRTLDQVTIIVPNSRFLETEVINWSHGDPVSRLRLPVGVAYGSNTEQVQAALLEAAKSHPEVLVRPQPQVWFQGFGDSAINFDLLVWTGEPKNQARVKSDLYYRIEASLRRYGIEVPFPQRDLNVRSPQLEEFISAWLRQNGSQPSDIAGKDSLNGKRGEHSQNSSVETQSQPSLATAVSAETITAVNVEVLVQSMREPGGLEIKDRYSRLNLYPACFVGSDAVDWLVQTQNCTREAATQLGQLLIDQGIMHHVLDQYPFQDNESFYRFYADEQISPQET